MEISARTTNKEYILALEGISKRFGGTLALSDTTLTLPRGKVVALVGENGAGKSTLINIISGLFRPDSGTIELDGEPVQWTGPAQAIKKGIAVVHQELTLFPNLTVAENVFAGNNEINLRFGRIDRETMHRRTGEILEMLGLKIDATVSANDLSLAEQQLVEVAKALVWNPRILILDEATSALDPNQVKRLFDAVRKLRDSGVAIIFVSHRMYEIEEIANQALVLKDGRIVASLDDEAMKNTTQDMLVEAMLGRAVEAVFPNKATARSKEVLLDVEGLVNDQLRGVSMQILPGEIVGLAGLRGHGQEELLRVLFGICPCKQGKVNLGNRPYVSRNPIHAIKSGFAYVPADRKTQGVAQELSIEVNLTSVTKKRMYSRIRFKEERDTIREIRRSLNIGQSVWNQQVRSLSGGNQQKVVLGKWLKSDFKVLLMDEPTRGIDVATKHEIYEFLRALAETGVAIVAVSTDTLELLGISDRIYVFYEGGIHAMLEGEALNEASLTSAIMGV